MAPDTSDKDEVFLSAGLQPLEAYTNAKTERRCLCLRCGTTRFVKASVLKSGGVACRWCHGWEKWTQPSRARTIRTNQSVEGLSATTLAETFEARALLPLGPLDQPHDPIGFLCINCGETGVTIPSLVHSSRRNYYGCPRCASAQQQATLANADSVFSAHGLRLLEKARGEYVPQAAECLECGSLRKVSLARLRDGTAPLCWSCTHGIMNDEPHRIYLFEFPALRVMKIGLTHARHDRRLFEHRLHGGSLVETVVVSNRNIARQVEASIRHRYALWRVPDVSSEDFPQGGWTETWSSDAPLLDLKAHVALFLEDT